MRSLWKGKFVSNTLNQSYKISSLDKSSIYERDSTILKEFVGLELNIHNGLTFYPLSIKEDMVGHKFGEFVFTKKTGTSIHKNQITKQAKKKK